MYKTSSISMLEQKNLKYLESSLSSTWRNNAEKIVKQNYIINDVSKCFAPKLIPYDNSTSKYNLKVSDSKSK